MIFDFETVKPRSLRFGAIVVCLALALQYLFDLIFRNPISSFERALAHGFLFFVACMAVYWYAATPLLKPFKSNTSKVPTPTR